MSKSNINHATVESGEGHFILGHQGARMAFREVVTVQDREAGVCDFAVYASRDGVVLSTFDEGVPEATSAPISWADWDRLVVMVGGLRDEAVPTEIEELW